MMACRVLLSKLNHGDGLTIFVRTLAIQTTAENRHDFNDAFAPLGLRIFLFMPEYQHFDAKAPANVEKKVIGEAQQSIFVCDDKPFDFSCQHKVHQFSQSRLSGVESTADVLNELIFLPLLFHAMIF